MPVYLDHNATSPPHPSVLQVALPLLTEHFANPSSSHSLARVPFAAVERARGQVAAWAGARPREVIFTGGATEANHLALRGLRRPGRPLVSAIEHPSVVEPAALLGAERVPVDHHGLLDLAALERLLERPTSVVSVMAANNETGVLQDIPAIARRVHAAGSLLHVDAAQIVGRLACPAGWDLLTLTAHKAGGLKGVGALLVREGIVLTPQAVGGGQERGRRSGTTNAGPIAGLGAVAELSHGAEIQAMRDRLERACVTLGGVVTSGGAPRLPNTVNVRFAGIPGDLLVTAMDLEGYCLSAGSACHSGAATASAVLQAMGIRTADAVRLSLGWSTTEQDVQGAIDALERVLPRLRRELTVR
jgi:cysteine desulfurase